MRMINLKVLVVTGLLFGCCSAFAVPVEWTLQDVYLENGEQITGSFVFDVDAPWDNCDIAHLCWSSGYSDFSFEIGSAAPWDAQSGAYVDLIEYSPGPSGPMDGALNLQVICCNGSALDVPSLVFGFSESLTNAGGVVSVDGAFYSGSFLGNSSLQITSGSIVANVIPIPAAAWLFASALAGLGWLRRRSLLINS